MWSGHEAVVMHAVTDSEAVSVSIGVCKKCQADCGQAVLHLLGSEVALKLTPTQVVMKGP